MEACISDMRRRSAYCGLGTAANAADITVTGYSLPDAQAYGAGAVNGYSYYDGPVILNVQGGPDIIAYCADMSHWLQGGAGYDYGLLTEDGNGNPLTEAQSNRIGRIASAGFAALAVNDGQLAAAAQLAIWSLEYNVAPTSFANTTIQNDFNFLESLSFPDYGYATVLIPDGNWPADTTLSQQMVIGFASGVPEASTWVMLAMGFAGLGLAGYRKARPAISIV